LSKNKKRGEGKTKESKCIIRSWKKEGSGLQQECLGQKWTWEDFEEGGLIVVKNGRLAGGI
jgi:hypothetical protein